MRPIREDSALRQVVDASSDAFGLASFVRSTAGRMLKSAVPILDSPVDFDCKLKSAVPILEIPVDFDCKLKSAVLTLEIPVDFDCKLDSAVPILENPNFESWLSHRTLPSKAPTLALIATIGNNDGKHLSSACVSFEISRI
mmetsp:Transcript_94610/g.149627  ORF Transcript_94610/g.149627 Transcript_94610/m.149627 type:complete len:141 (-) Transcript_94610:1066-1488(-)